MEASRETFPELPSDTVACSCLNCKQVILVPAVGPRPAVCDCGQAIEIPSAQFAERLFAEDEAAKDRILFIDLGVYNVLVLQPAAADWPRDRKRILFLQTALRLGVPWAVVVQLTRPYFGQILESPPIIGVSPIDPTPFSPPAFDIAHQTPEDWARCADEAWRTHRDAAVATLREWRRI